MARPAPSTSATNSISWGSNRAAVSAAKSTLAAAEAEQQQARLILTTTLAQAYAELARLYANHDTAVTGSRSANRR